MKLVGAENRKVLEDVELCVLESVTGNPVCRYSQKFTLFRIGHHNYQSPITFNKEDRQIKN